VEVCVTDTGTGIAGENHERIFHEFEQIVGTTSRGGTGLGLPISRKLARLLGGELTVRSELGQGAAFTLRLPVHLDDHRG
jgi:signal transduction histidine kinase